MDWHEPSLWFLMFFKYVHWFSLIFMDFQLFSIIFVDFCWNPWFSIIFGGTRGRVPGPGGGARKAGGLEHIYTCAAWQLESARDLQIFGGFRVWNDFFCVFGPFVLVLPWFCIGFHWFCIGSQFSKSIFSFFWSICIGFTIVLHWFALVLHWWP